MEHPAPVYETVSCIARQLEVCENTIRKWERDGLISGAVTGVILLHAQREEFLRLPAAYGS